MALRTPKRNSREGIHGEKEAEPLFRGSTAAGDTSDPRGVYDNQTSPMLNPADPRNDKKSVSPRDLADAESTGARSASSVGSSEENRLAVMSKHAEQPGLFSGKEKAGRLSRIKTRLKVSKKKSIIGLVTGGVVGGGIFGFSIIQGPLQMIHFAQLLQKFHFSRNEDFGDNRTSKVLLYSLLGKGAERGRLGITSNVAADKFEKRLEKDFGLRPVYTTTTGRFAGYQIMHDSGGKGLDPDGKAMRLFRSYQDQNNLTVRDGDDSGGRQRVKTSGGNPLLRGDTYVDLRGLTSKQKRAVIRAVAKEMGIWKISSTINARNLIKRGGVKFNFFTNEKLQKLVDDRADKSEEKKRRDDYEKNILKRWSKTVKTGIIKSTGKNKEAQQLAEVVDQQTEGESESETKKKRISAAKAAGPVAVVGIICSVKGLGDEAETVKYANNVLPMMRMGTGVVAMGNQAMSGDNINLDELGVMSKQLYDKEAKTSWTNARSIQAEMGKPQTGPDIPKEAKLGRISDKGDFFEVVDFLTGIPPGPININTGCSAINAVSSLPIISHISALLQAAIDAPLGLAGTSTEELTLGLIGIINGNNINPLAKGAEFGGLVNTGAFLAANDQAISTGGTALSATETAQLDALENSLDKEEQSHKPLLARYFDPYDRDSLTGKMIDTTPRTFSQVATLANPIKALGDSFASLFSSVTPRTQAASSYDYGTKTYGFSLNDQENDMFEDPYENAIVVEKQLPALNDKYGRCFGMKVDENGSLQNDKSVNVFKLEKEKEYKDCREDKDKEIFKRYKFYIADTVTAKSLACYEGEEEACGELGASGQASSTEGDPASNSSESGETIGDLKIKKVRPALRGASSGGEIDPKGITLHWWGSQSDNGIQPLLDTFKGNGLSVQLGITSDGEVYQLTKSLTTKTSHAIGANNRTIGIEIEGGPEEFGKAGIAKYPKKFEAVVATVKYLMKKYNIPIEGSTACDNVSGIHPHSAYNHCPGASPKSDVDSYYFNEVIKRVK